MNRGFVVTIQATIIKNVFVQAQNKEEADELAHQIFSVECDGPDERYDQRTLDIEEEFYND